MKKRTGTAEGCWIKQGGGWTGGLRRFWQWAAQASRRAGLTCVAWLPLLAWSAEPRVLRFNGGGFATLDPVRVRDTGSGDLVSLTYSTLVSYHYLARPLRLVPDLLVKMPEWSAAERTFSFELRPGVKFRDDPCFAGGRGRELVVDDVLYSLKRAADANIDGYIFAVIAGVFEGLDEFHEKSRRAGPALDYASTPVSGFQKVDRYRFKLRLTQENPLALQMLAMPQLAIVPREAVAYYGEAFGRHPVGTGPFVLQEAQRKGTLRLVKNATYHRFYPGEGEPSDQGNGLLADAGRRLPLANAVEYHSFGEKQPAMLSFLRGDLDWTMLDPAWARRLLLRTVDAQGQVSWQVRPENATRLRLHPLEGLGVNFLHINLADPLLGANKKLRQALVHLVDTHSMIDLLDGGMAKKAKSMIPAALAGGPSDTGSTYPGHDLSAAKRLLVEAGFPQGKGLPAITYLSSRGPDAFDLMRARFAAAGVRLLPDYGDLLRKAVTGRFQIMDSSQTADYPDAESYYGLLSSRMRAASQLQFQFASPAYDAAYETSRFMHNGPERYRHFRRMDDIIKDEVPVILTTTEIRLLVAHRWLRNFKPNPMISALPYLDIDLGERSGRKQ